jgi:small-conductance mechanosensitive channel
MNLNQEFQLLLAKIIDFIPHLITALVVFGVALFVSNIAAKWVLQKSKTKVKNIETSKLLSTITRWTILVLGIVIALEQVNFNVTGFVAGLGVAGFTIGFALQDIAKNFVSGILLVIRQPFQVGDAVELSGFEGKVTDITLRDTVVETWDGEVVILPNMSVYSNPIKNFSGLKNRRRIIQIGVDYEVDLEKAQNVILESVKSVEGVLLDPHPMVLAKEFGASEIVLQVYFWIDQTQNSIIQIPSDVILSIKDAAKRESINIPYPIQTVQLSKTDFVGQD